MTTGLKPSWHLDSEAAPYRWTPRCIQNMTSRLHRTCSSFWSKLCFCQGIGPKVNSILNYLSVTKEWWRASSLWMLFTGQETETSCIHILMNKGGQSHKPHDMICKREQLQIGSPLFYFHFMILIFHWGCINTNSFPSQNQIKEDYSQGTNLMFSHAVPLGLNKIGKQNSENNSYSSVKWIFPCFHQWVGSEDGRKERDQLKKIVFYFKSEEQQPSHTSAG